MTHLAGSRRRHSLREPSPAVAATGPGIWAINNGEKRAKNELRISALIARAIRYLLLGLIVAIILPVVTVIVVSVTHLFGDFIQHQANDVGPHAL